jgi:hypothetical protein
MSSSTLCQEPANWQAAVDIGSAWFSPDVNSQCLSLSSSSIKKTILSDLSKDLLSSKLMRMMLPIIMKLIVIKKK